jgi:hypothetical protein
MSTTQQAAWRACLQTVKRVPRPTTALLGAAIALLTSCASVPEPSASVTRSVTPSVAPSVAPRSTAVPTPTVTAPTPSPSASSSGPIEVGGYAQTPDDGLALRDRPLGTGFTEVLAGSDLWVLEIAGGWALVEGQDPATLAFGFGWAPAADLVAHAPFACDLSPEMAWRTAGLHPQRALECQGDVPLILEGFAVEGPGMEPAYAGEPSWLAETPAVWLSSVIGPAATGFWVPMHVPPGFADDVPMSDREGLEGTLLRVTGHYDDPTSAGCAHTVAREGYPAMDAERSEIWCRQQLVVDSIEVLDPG